MKRLDPKYIVQKLQTQVDNLMSGDKLSDRLKRVDWSAEKESKNHKISWNLGNDTKYLIGSLGYHPRTSW